jgi:hypothetical protein
VSFPYACFARAGINSGIAPAMVHGEIMRTAAQAASRIWAVAEERGFFRGGEAGE